MIASIKDVFVALIAPGMIIVLVVICFRISRSYQDALATLTDALKEAHFNYAALLEAYAELGKRYFSIVEKHGDDTEPQ